MRRRIQIAMASGFWLLASGLFAQINSDSLIAVYTTRMQKYLDKDNKASEVFSFTKEGIEVYAPATDTSQRKLEYFFHWDIYFMSAVLKNYNLSEALAILLKNEKVYYDDKLYLKFSFETLSSIPRKGIRTCADCDPNHLNLLQYNIAIDPGHIAGDIETAKMEKKWVEMKANPVKGIKEDIQLIEGELTLATAKILKNKLEAEGAAVMLTRDKPNISSFGIDFKKWKDSLFVQSLDSAYARGDVSFEERNYLLIKANDTEIFRRFFAHEEIKARASKINEFHPDLTIVIHYNVDETNPNWNKPTKKNFNMAFVGGSFTEDELDKPETRIEFLRLLLTDDIKNSIEFSKYIMESLVQKTGVPAAFDSIAVYLRDNCMKTDASGVFCRNLTLTRMVKGTLVYGESLYQDNITECKLLSKKDIMIDGMKTSKRVEEVAEGYFQGVMNYVKSKK